MRIITDKLIEIYGISDIYLSDSKAFKQQQIQKTFTLSLEESEIKELHSVNAVIQISEYRIEASITGKSYEGQFLSQKKLIVDGYIQYRFEYISVDLHESVLARQFSIPFNLPVVLGDELYESYSHKVFSNIEDIYIRLVGQRQIYTSTTLMLSVQQIINN